MSKKNHKIDSFIDSLKIGNLKKVKEIWLIMNPIERSDALKEFENLDKDEKIRIEDEMSVVEEKFWSGFKNYSPENDSTSTTIDFMRNPVAAESSDVEDDSGIFFGAASSEEDDEDKINQQMFPSFSQGKSPLQLSDEQIVFMMSQIVKQQIELIDNMALAMSVVTKKEGKELVEDLMSVISPIAHKFLLEISKVEKNISGPYKDILSERSDVLAYYYGVLISKGIPPEVAGNIVSQESAKFGFLSEECIRNIWNGWKHIMLSKLGSGGNAPQGLGGIS